MPKGRVSFVGSPLVVLFSRVANPLPSRPRGRQEPDAAARLRRASVWRARLLAGPSPTGRPSPAMKAASWFSLVSPASSVGASFWVLCCEGAGCSPPPVSAPRRPGRHVVRYLNESASATQSDMLSSWACTTKAACFSRRRSQGRTRHERETTRTLAVGRADKRSLMAWAGRRPRALDRASDARVHDRAQRRGHHLH